MKPRFLIGISILGGALTIAGTVMLGCSPNTAAPELLLRPTASPDQEGTAEVSAAAAQMVFLEPFSDQACLDCHTDQARLTELALPEETTEELSSGPG